MASTTTKRKPNKHGNPASWRPQQRDRDLLAQLSEKLGVTHSDVLRMALREYAEKREARGV